MRKFQQQISDATQVVREQIGERDIDAAVIVGSGLGEIGGSIENPIHITYSSIPNLPTPSITSHKGEILVCETRHRRVAYCRGRVHLYEGYSAQEVALLIYVLHQLGVAQLIITNAAGALNSDYTPGEIMLITDHINMTGHNPIRGQDDSLGQRFTDMSRTYAPELAQKAQQSATCHGLNLQSGIYAGVLGPSLETSAERRMLRMMGADAVGMSTVMEVIAANHCGMQVLGLSAISNRATGDADQQEDTIDAVMANAASAADGMNKIITDVLDQRRAGG